MGQRLTYVPDRTVPFFPENVIYTNNIGRINYNKLNIIYKNLKRIITTRCPQRLGGQQRNRRLPARVRSGPGRFGIFFSSTKNPLLRAVSKRNNYL